jgi:hypothetical protein
VQEKIPLEDRIALVTREHAIEEGIKANRTHAHRNSMDFAKILKA